MEFKNIQLPPFVVAGLYRRSLVLLENETIGNDLLANKLEITNDQPIKRKEQLVDKGKNEQSVNVEIEKTIAKVEVKIKEEPSGAEIKAKIPEIKERAAEIDNQSISVESFQRINKPATNEPLMPAPDIPKIKYLGGFGKKISIVLAEHFQPHISDEDLAFLSKLLQACQLSLNDVAIINVVSNGTVTTKLWQLMPAEKMIMFDVDPGTLGIPFRSPQFLVQPWNDCLFLVAPSLQELQEGPQEKTVLLKRKLWDSLKKMFAL